MKKSLISIIAALVASLALGQVNVQKTSGTNTLTGNIVAGNNTTISATGNGTITATALTGNITGNPVISGNLTVNGTVDSSSKDTGAIVTEGGLGVEKSATVGGNLTVNGKTVLYSDGTAKWGDAANARVLTWDTAKAIITGQTGYDLYLGGRGQQTLTLGASHAATLAGSLTLSSGTSNTFSIGSGSGAPSNANPYAYLNGLRVSGGDTQNTIYNGTRNIGVTADSGYAVFIGQSNSTIGLSVDTTNGNATFAGNVQIGAAANVTQGGRQLGIVAASSYGYLEVGSNAADADATAYGAFSFSNGSGNSNHKQLAQIAAYTDGATSGQRGGKITFGTKGNASTVVTTALTLDSSQNATFAGAVRSNAQEGFKIAAASGYFAGYEADGTTLNGYLQFINSTGTLLNQSIAGKNIALAIAGTPQLTLTTGNATFAGTVTAGTWASGNASKLRVANTTNDWVAYIANTASSGNAYGLRLHTDLTTSGDYLISATSGSGSGSTRFAVKANGTINAPSLPTSSAGLSAGDIWNDGGTLKIV